MPTIWMRFRFKHWANARSFTVFCMTLIERSNTRSVLVTMRQKQQKSSFIMLIFVISQFILPMKKYQKVLHETTQTCILYIVVYVLSRYSFSTWLFSASSSGYGRTFCNLVWRSLLEHCHFKRFKGFKACCRIFFFTKWQF